MKINYPQTYIKMITVHNTSEIHATQILGEDAAKPQVVYLE
jgi:hypothetical protein